VASRRVLLSRSARGPSVVAGAMPVFLRAEFQSNRSANSRRRTRHLYVGPITPSRYAADTETETLMFFKLSQNRQQAFQEKLRSLHPYEVPEIICVKIDNGLPEYLRWGRGELWQRACGSFSHGANGLGSIPQPREPVVRGSLPRTLRTLFRVRVARCIRPATNAARHRRVFPRITA
jgi:CutA1 divalent ion tolerance protein